MTQRRFAPRCGECRQKTMAIATIPYSIQIDHDGKKYDVHVPALSVPKCSNCGAISIDDLASEQIDRAFRRIAKLLTPGEIREGRTGLGLQQQALAQYLGIGVSTLSRWENGAQIQQRAMDKLLRLFFDVPEARAYLGFQQTQAVPAGLELATQLFRASQMQPLPSLPALPQFVHGGIACFGSRATNAAVFLPTNAAVFLPTNAAMVGEKKSAGSEWTPTEYVVRRGQLGCVGVED